MSAILEAKWRENNGYNTVDYVGICLKTTQVVNCLTKCYQN